MLLRLAVVLLAAAFLAGTALGAGSGPRATPPAPTPAKGAVPWKAPGDPLRRTRLAGLVPERFEQLAHHVHAHLDVFVNAAHIRVPAGIGINVRDPGVKRFETPDGPAWGGISRCDKPCISPLHTHDATGILHTESAASSPNRLGQFFVEWGVRLDRTCVGGYCKPKAAIAVYVNGKRYAGDPRKIQLLDGREIAIVIGTPPAIIPSTGDFSGA
jgi:hypothetical protein